MKLDVHIQVFEKICNIRSWFLLSFSTKKKHYTIFKLWTCSRLNFIHVVLLNKKFYKKFGKK